MQRIWTATYHLDGVARLRDLQSDEVLLTMAAEDAAEDARFRRLLGRIPQLAHERDLVILAIDRAPGDVMFVLGERRRS